jgi:hypothetical protein
MIGRIGIARATPFEPLVVISRIYAVGIHVSTYKDNNLGDTCVILVFQREVEIEMLNGEASKDILIG